MFGAGRTRARKPALRKARLPMQNLLRPFSGALRHNRIGRAGSPLPDGPFRAYEWRRVPHMRDAPYRRSALLRPCGRELAERFFECGDRPASASDGTALGSA